MSTGSLWESGGCGLESMCCFMDWKDDTWEFLEEDEEWSVEERESGVVVCNDAVDEAIVEDGVTVDEDEDDEGLDECLLD